MKGAGNRRSWARVMSLLGDQHTAVGRGDGQVPLGVILMYNPMLSCAMSSMHRSEGMTNARESGGLHQVVAPHPDSAPRNVSTADSSS